MGLAKNITGDLQDAQECVSDTLLKAWNKIPPVIPLYLFAYLAKIARSFAFDIYDKKHAKKRDSRVTELTGELEECVCELNNEFEALELKEAINTFLRKQTLLDKELFIQRYFWGYTITEIANSMKISESKVTARLFQTRKKLKIALEKELYL